jgi:PAS domain S-box-containing protein
VNTHGTARILIVEDEPIIAQATAHLLRNLGYEVTATVADGEEALERAGECLPDLVLMDIELEGCIDGIETAIRLRSSLDVPVVFLSAYGDQERLDRAKIAEPMGFLVKPFDGTELHATIAVALYRSLRDRRLRDSHDELERRVNERTAELLAAHERMKETTALLAQAERIGRLGAWKYKLGTDELVWSEGASRIFKLYPEERVVKSEEFFSLVHPEDLEYVKHSVEETLSGGKPYVVHRIILPDSEVRFVHVRAEVVRDDEGRPVEMVGFVQDVTERKEAEDRLRSAHDELAYRLQDLTAINNQTRETARLRSIDQLVSYTRKQLIEAIAPDIVIVYLFEAEGLVMQGERPDIAGFSEKLEVGECFCGLAASEGTIITSTDIRSDPRCALDACRNSGIRSFCAVPLVVEDTIIGVLAVGSNTERDFSKDELLLDTFAGQLAIGFNNAKLFDQLQKSHGDLERRVNERTAKLNEANRQLRKKNADLRSTQRSLGESEERFRELAEMLPPFVYEVDLKGNFTFLNRAALDAGGYTLEDLAEGLSIFDVLISEDAEDLATDLAEVLGGTSVRDLEYSVRRKDGATFPCVLFAGPIFRDNRVVGLRGVGLDITERRQAEKARDQLIEEIKHFAHIVSHDLHAPLVNLNGFLGELKTGLDEIFPVVEKMLPSMEEGKRSRITHMLEEDIPESLSFMDASITRMNRLIEAVLDMSRAGRRDLVFEYLDMNELVDRTLDTLSYQIEASGAEVRVGALPGTVADRTAVDQIIGNLLTNALKYLDPERPAIIEITGMHGPEENVFVVSDTGRGIAEHDLSRIFRIFERSGNRSLPGEGIGLAYARTMVRRHGGRIWCESEPGKGATFTFTIANRGQERDATPSSHSSMNGADR